MENIKNFNLNHSTMFISNFDYGITTGAIKAGHKLYNYCVKKNNSNTFFELWQGEKSKYNNDTYIYLFLNNKAVIYKESIFVLKQLATAQFITNQYKNILA